MSKYKQSSSLELRRAKFERLQRDYPDMVPLVVELVYKKEDLPELPRSSMLVDKNLTVRQLQTIIRKKLLISNKQSIFLMVQDAGQNKLLEEDTIQRVYARYRDEDGMLYLGYSGSETFGAQ